MTVNYLNSVPANAAVALTSTTYIIFTPSYTLLQKSFSMEFTFEGGTTIYLGDKFIIIFPKFDTGFFPSDKGVGVELIMSGVHYI